MIGAALATAATGARAWEGLGERDGGDRLDGPVLESYGDFYAARNLKPFWTEGGQVGEKRFASLLSGMGNLETHGIPVREDAVRTLQAEWDALWSGPVEHGRRTLAEKTFMDAFVGVAEKLARGIIDPGSISGMHIDRATLDENALFEDLIAGLPPAEVLEAQAPASAAYARLKEKYGVLRKLISEGRWMFPVDPGPDLVPNSKDYRNAQARARLHELGDLEWREQWSDHYDLSLYEGVRAFQSRHGLPVDGIAGQRTLAEMNVSSISRMGQLAVAMERMRWRPREMASRHVWVNMADFRVSLVEDGRVVFSTGAVIGSPSAATPEFTGSMDHIVINPSWYIPAGIAKNEIEPEIARDPNYLSDNNIVRLGPGRYVQKPGPGNALGEVKFMFPNKYAIYLHDTPWKELFGRDLRAYSHGCVRLEKPHDFGRELVVRDRGPGAWEDYRTWLKSGRETRVNLDTEIPVQMTYQTAWVDADGEIQIRRDIYKRDKAILSALSREGLRPPPHPRGLISGYLEADAVSEAAYRGVAEPYSDLAPPPSSDETGAGVGYGAHYDGVPARRSGEVYGASHIEDAPDVYRGDYRGHPQR